MDGTLLNSNHQVSDHFFELFHKLNDRGIQFVAASGRQYHSMASKLRQIKDDIIFIAENGAIIREREKELSSTPLAPDLVGRLVRIIRDIDNVGIMLCGKSTSYFDPSSSQFLEDLVEYYSKYEVVEHFDLVEEEIVKIAVYHGVSSELYLYPTVQSYAEDVLVKVSGRHWMDINHVNAHKGNALKKVMNALGVNANEVLVFGDYYNDLEMLGLVDHSFAMANAHPKVKEMANFETASNDAFGVEKVLEKLFQ